MTPEEELAKRQADKRRKADEEIAAEMAAYRQKKAAETQEKERKKKGCLCTYTYFRQSFKRGDFSYLNEFCKGKTVLKKDIPNYGAIYQCNQCHHFFALSINGDHGSGSGDEIIVQPLDQILAEQLIHQA